MVRAAINWVDYVRFLEIMRINTKHGAFTVYPCQCDPHCGTKLQDGQDEKLADRLEWDIQNNTEYCVVGDTVGRMRVGHFYDVTTGQLLNTQAR